jgi:U3 small nucleolar RNA-associated protein 14
MEFESLKHVTPD